MYDCAKLSGRGDSELRSTYEGNTGEVPEDDEEDPSADASENYLEAE